MTESTHLLEADDSNFDELVLQHDTPCLVDFWAPWCGPCKMLMPTITAAAERWAGKVRIVKVNVDNSPNTAGKYNVRSIPTLMVFHNGEMKQSQLGMMSAADLDRMIEDHV